MFVDRVRSMPVWLTVLAGLEVGGGLSGVALCAIAGVDWIRETVSFNHGVVTLPISSYTGGTLRFVGLPGVILAFFLLVYAASVAAGCLILLRRRLGLLAS